MQRPKKYSTEELPSALKPLTGWQLENNSIIKEFKFLNFIGAFAFMTKIALAAEKMNHHPDWSNVYNRVRVRLSTHDADGITDLDIKLAQQIDKFYQNGF